MSSAFPDSKGQNVELTQPTSEEILQQLHHNSSEWKGALSLEAYIRREEHLGKQSLVKDGGLTPWALVTKNADSPRKVLSGCETIRKKALVAKNGQVKEVICHGVASVFCPPECRGRGYAGRMIKDLGSTLQHWQTDDKECLFSVLYSDIGKQFYAAHSWKPFASAHVSLQPSPKSANPSLPKAKPLYASDMADLCKIDEDLLRKRISKSASADKPLAAIISDVDTLTWHFAREDFVSNELYGKSPEIKGAMVGTEQGSHVWCVWMRTWANPDAQATKGNSMYIIRLVVEDPNHSDSSAASEEGAEAARNSKVAAATASLMALAQTEASKWHMGEVDIWNPTSTTLAAARMLDPRAKVIHREKDSIASLRWYGAEPADDVEWIENEKYAWC